MKKIGQILLLLLTTQLLQAQYSEYPKGTYDLSSVNFENVRIGIKVSPSISWLDVTHSDVVQGGASTKVGIGLTAHYNINSLLSITTAVNYANFGGYVSDSKSFADLSTKDYYKINYSAIETPIGIKLKTPILNKYDYYVHGGVQTNFLMRAKEQYFDANTGKKVREQDILTDYTHPTVVGFFGGIGAGYEIHSKLRIFAELQYKHMLTTVSIGDNYTKDARYDDPLYLYPRSMELSFGLEF